MKLSLDSWKHPRGHKPWFSWRTSTTLVFDGETTQLSTHSPGSSCRYFDVNGGGTNKERYVARHHINKPGGTG